LRILIVVISCALLLSIIGGLALSEVVTPYTIIEDGSWGYYVDYCTQIQTYDIMANDTVVGTGQYFKYCNI